MEAYTTEEKVRREAGFSGNTNITDDTITDAMNAAHSVVVGAIGQFYTLPLSEVPAILELVERRLAAGYLMTDEYGEDAEGTSKDGQKKIDWATEQLKSITDEDVQLYDGNGVLLSMVTTAGLQGFPLVSDPNDDVAGERAFTRDMEF